MGVLRQYENVNDLVKWTTRRCSYNSISRNEKIPAGRTEMPRTRITTSVSLQRDEHHVERYAQGLHVADPEYFKKER